MILWVILTLVAVLIGALYIYCAQQYARLPHIKGPRVKFPFGAGAYRPECAPLS